jgi:hypothetical protein
VTATGKCILLGNRKRNFPAKYSLLKLSTLTDKGIGHWGLEMRMGGDNQEGID